MCEEIMRAMWSCIEILGIAAVVCVTLEILQQWVQHDKSRAYFRQCNYPKGFEEGGAASELVHSRHAMQPKDRLAATKNQVDLVEAAMKGVQAHVKSLSKEAKRQTLTCFYEAFAQHSSGYDAEIKQRMTDIHTVVSRKGDADIKLDIGRDLTHTSEWGQWTLNWVTSLGR